MSGELCKECKGKGFLVWTVDALTDTEESAECDNCKGTGKIENTQPQPSAEAMEAAVNIQDMISEGMAMPNERIASVIHRAIQAAVEKERKKAVPLIVEIRWMLEMPASPSKERFIDLQARFMRALARYRGQQ